MSPRSMTGYARVHRTSPLGDMVATLKGVNHRALDIHIHLPLDLEPAENALRSRLKEHIGRGHVEFRLQWIRGATTVPPALNQALLSAYLGAFRTASKEFGLTGAPDLNAALRIPGMLGEAAATEPDEQLLADLLTLAGEAIERFNGFRELEGKALVADMRNWNRLVLEGGQKLEKIREQAVPVFQARLHERLSVLLSGTAIDPVRLTQEAAILADRSDIAEEISRLKIHSSQLDQILAGGGEMGKKIDFLLQEMNRETNTVLSKTSGLGEVGLTVTEIALGLKSHIEKIREQALNLE